MLVRLCNYLRDAGYKHSILTTSIIPEIIADLDGTDIIICENKNRGKAKVNADIVAGEITALKRGLKKHGGKFDVLNPHNYPAEIVAMSSSLPSVWMCNEPELYLTLQRPDFKKIWIRERISILALYYYEKLFLKKRISRAVVSDDFNASRFQSIFGFQPVIINYGIDFDFFSNSGQGNGDADRKKFSILHVGLITRLKNQMASLETLTVLKDRIPNVHLIFAGSIMDPAYKSELDRYIEKHSLADYVEFRGHVNRSELKTLYYQADVMLHPIKSQGGWLSPFEMLCAEKPIVVSSDLTAAYIIREQKIGIVTDNYPESIYRVYESYSSHLDMARRGKEYVRNNLSWDAFSGKFLEQFTGVCKSR